MFPDRPTAEIMPRRKHELLFELVPLLQSRRRCARADNVLFELGDLRFVRFLGFPKVQVPPRRFVDDGLSLSLSVGEQSNGYTAKQSMMDGGR
jgi:hypothetical protein